MKISQVVIRADGSSQIGMGHLVRCFALALMIKKEFGVRLFAKEIPKPISEEFQKNGFEVTKLSLENDFLTHLTGSEIVVLDHYELDSVYQAKIKERGCKLVCIDDLHDKFFFADLIINHAPGVYPEDYRAQSYTQFALGLDYVLLRPAFLKASGRFKKPTENHNENVLICFGGVDALNLTKDALEVVLAANTFQNINIVVGNGYQDSFYKELEKMAQKNDSINLFRAVSDEKMVEVMQQSHIAIVPCSGILLEALSLGLKVISGMYVENQKFIYHHYKASEAFIDAEDFSKEKIAYALNNCRNHRKTKNPIDGRSGNRILKIFHKFQIEDEINIRKATTKDMETTFRWASDPVIREFSFNKEPIKFKEHSNWFTTKLQDEDCFYLIAEKENNTIGSVRFDIVKDEAVISYLVDPKYHGSGYGIIILQKSVEAIKNSIFNFTRIVGYVKPENKASVKVFQRLGYTRFPYPENNKIKFIKELKENGN